MDSLKGEEYEELRDIEDTSQEDEESQEEEELPKRRPSSQRSRRK